MSYVRFNPRIIISSSHGNTSKYVDTVTLKKKSKNNHEVIHPKMTFDPTSVEVTYVPLPKDRWIQVPWKYIEIYRYSDFFQKTWTKGHWPLGDLCPKSDGVTCVTLPKDHCVQVPWKYIKVCGYSDPFFKNFNQMTLTLYDLWPHVCWGHMCDCTQGSLCPSPMEIHQCMWIQWSILQNTTYYIHTYYVQNKWSHKRLFVFRVWTHVTSASSPFAQSFSHTKAQQGSDNLPRHDDTPRSPEDGFFFSM